MKILFVWTGVTSYMADCWRTLAAEPGIELKVVVEQVASGRDFDAANVLHGLEFVLTDSCLSRCPRLSRPDVMFVCGWHSKVVRTLVSRSEWKDVPKVCCSDMPWRWKCRCIAARFVLWRYLRQFSCMMVPGKSGHRYARWLGFSEERIFEGMYGIDVSRFKRTDIFRKRGKGFLYLGRFVPEKRLDVLLEAYMRYRERGGRWPLDLYGAGPLKTWLAQTIKRSDDPAICLHSFVQPSEVPQLYAEHGAFVLASDFDPWPLVILESCASGLPVVVTDRCTNHFEFVRRNGLIVPSGNAEILSKAMLRMEREQESFDVEAGRRMAANYSCSAWCQKVLRVIRELRGAV